MPPPASRLRRRSPATSTTSPIPLLLLTAIRLVSRRWWSLLFDFGFVGELAHHVDIAVHFFRFFAFHVRISRLQRRLRRRIRRAASFSSSSSLRSIHPCDWNTTRHKSATDVRVCC